MFEGLSLVVDGLACGEEFVCFHALCTGIEVLTLDEMGPFHVHGSGFEVLGLREEMGSIHDHVSGFEVLSLGDELV